MHTILVGPELEESLALRYLSAAMTRAGHTCTIVPFNKAADAARVTARVRREKPGLIGLSLVAQRRYPDYRALVSRLRGRRYRGHITAGGHFAGLRAAEILRDTPGLDSVIHHDGEQRIVDLAGVVQRGDALPGAVNGISWRGATGDLCHVAPAAALELDRLPFPTRRRPERTLGYGLAPLVSSRGCAGSCSFCSIHAWHRQAPGKRLRFRSPESVAEEMIELHRRRDVRVFIFHDDDFVHPDPGKALERCRAIFDSAEDRIGEPFSFVIKSRPDRIDERLFSYLKSKGLARVYVGIETHARSGLDVLNRRIAPETNVRALDILTGLGIYSCFNLLLFHPDTTIAELQENLDFLEVHQDLPFEVGRTELYAASRLESRMIAEGRALGDYRGYDYRIADPRAESVFQRWVDVFWERHFDTDSILHRSQDLGFRLSLLRRFEPGMVTPDLEARVNGLIREINGDTVRFVRRMIDDQERTVECEPARATRSAEELRRDLNSRSRRQSARWSALSLEMEIRALVARVGLGAFRPAGLPGVLHLATRTPAFTMVAGALAGCIGNRVLDPPPPPTHFAEDIEPQLNQQCAVSGCHNASDQAGGLVLSTGVSYDNLVEKPSHELPGMLLVKPGDPDSSYLFRKLAGTQTEVGGSGDQMPPGPDPALTDDVWRWIHSGARKD